MNLLIKISTNENDEYIIKQKISTNEIDEYIIKQKISTNEIIKNREE